MPQVSHVGEHHPLGVVGQCRSQRRQPWLGHGDQHGLLQGESAPDERHNRIQEAAGPAVQQALVTVGVVGLAGSGQRAGARREQATTNDRRIFVTAHYSKMPAVVGRDDGSGVGQDQFDERHGRRCQAVIQRGVRQGLVEHILITGTGKDPITAGNNAVADESLQGCAMTLFPGRSRPVDPITVGGVRLPRIHPSWMRVDSCAVAAWVRVPPLFWRPCRRGIGHGGRLPAVRLARVCLLQQEHQCQPARELDGFPAVRPARRAFDVVIGVSRHIENDPHPPTLLAEQPTLIGTVATQGASAPGNVSVAPADPGGRLDPPVCTVRRPRRRLCRPGR